MTKKELIQKIAAATKLKNAQVESVIDALVEEVQGIVRDGDELMLPGLGKFSVTTRAARNGYNPATGQAIDIPERRAPKFAAAKALKDAAA